MVFIIFEYGVNYFRILSLYNEFILVFDCLTSTDGLFKVIRTSWLYDLLTKSNEFLPSLFLIWIYLNAYLLINEISSFLPFQLHNKKQYCLIHLVDWN